MDLNINTISNYVSRFLDVDIEKLPDHFAPAKKDDFEKLIKFRESLFQRGAPWDDATYIKWRYTFDPEAQEKNNIWIFKKNNEILGCVGIEKLYLVINNKEYKACKTMDLLVKPQLHGIGLGIWMLLAVKEKFSIVLAVGSNKNSYPIAAKIYKEMQSLKMYKLYFSVKVQLKRVLKFDFLSTMVSLPIDLVLLKYLSRGLRLPDDYSSKLLDSIPDEVNEFNSQNDKIHVLQDKNYLTWRFLKNPRRKYIILGLYQLDRLKAISVSSILYSEASNQKEGFIVDWLFDGINSTDDLQMYLYQETVKHLKKQNVKLIHISAYDDKSGKSLSRLGFFLREEKKPFFTYTSRKEIQRYLYNNDSWLLSEGDSDTDLF